MLGNASNCRSRLSANDQSMEQGAAVPDAVNFHFYSHVLTVTGISHLATTAAERRNCGEWLVLVSQIYGPPRLWTTAVCVVLSVAERPGINNLASWPQVTRRDLQDMTRVLFG